MKRMMLLVIYATCSVASVSCVANETGYILSYEKDFQQIKSDDGRSFLKFEERDEGNASYYFDYFGGKPSVVHDSDSLDSYSVFSVIERDKINFRINCIYADFKSGRNGIVSKEGFCGLDKKLTINHLFQGVKETILSME